MDSLHPHALFQQELSFTDSPQDKKQCSNCHQTKPLRDFPARNNRRVGIQPHCKLCNAERVSKYSKAHPEYNRSRNLLNNYGITIPEYNALLVSQGGVCKVCYGPPLGKGCYHVDHDHSTGIIRGLLCHKCNVALGMVQDNKEHLQALIAYLQEGEQS